MIDKNILAEQEDMTMEIATMVDLDTFASIVESVAETCFDEDGKYIAWMKDVGLCTQ